MPADTASRKNGNIGRKRADYSKNVTLIKSVPFNRRGIVRGLAFAIGFPPTTTFRLLAEYSMMKRATSTVKPSLTAENKLTRIQFCLSHVTPSVTFMPMYDTVHIDEKWFYLTKIKRSYYLMLDEEPPHRLVKSKRFITKVMFMATVARPQFDQILNCWFNE